MSFVKRVINLTFRLGKGSFGESGYDTLTVSGLRIRANIINAGGDSMGVANVRVNGLTRSQMNDLSTFIRSPQGVLEVRYNVLIIEAGEEGKPLDKIFEGQIGLAVVDMANAPDVALNITAYAGYFEAVKDADAKSYPGTPDAVTIMQTLAKENGYTFENLRNISAPIDTPNLRGSARDQMARVAKSGRFNWTIDNGVLAIWPFGDSRGDTVAEISPDLGMVGYPLNVGTGIGVKTLFNHNLQLGKLVKVTSEIPYANGTFVIFNIGHDIESETPGGAWFTQIEGSPYL